MNNYHIKKMIRPILIVIFIIVFLFYRIKKEDLFGYDFSEPVGIIFFVLALIALLSFLYTLIVTLIERIKEIRKGEDDDLGNY